MVGRSEVVAGRAVELGIGREPAAYTFCAFVADVLTASVVGWRRATFDEIESCLHRTRC